MVISLIVTIAEVVSLMSVNLCIVHRHSVDVPQNGPGRPSPTLSLQKRLH